MAINDYKIYSVKSTKSYANCYEMADDMAKDDFQNSICNMVEDEQIRAYLKPGNYFIYQWSRSDDNDNEIVIGSWKCTSKN